MSWWLELVIGIVVMSALVVLLGPGLWSSRVNLKKSDDDPRSPPKP